MTAVKAPLLRTTPKITNRAKENALFNSVGEGVFSTNEKGELERINDVALTMFGFKRSEVIGKWYPGVIEAFRGDGSPVKRIDRPIAKAFLTGKPVTDKVFYKRKDGSLFPAHVSVAPIIIRNRPVGAIEIFRDISLEVKLDRIKSDFISLASHQLRTPLSAINTYANMLADGYAGKLNNDQGAFIDTILTAANRMNDLINILLNVTRVESGSITVKVSPTNLVNLARELVTQFELEAEKFKINLRLNSSLKHTKIKTDSLLVKEVLSNFISNALKYSPAGSAVYINLSENKNSAVVSVTDRGLGIPENVQNFIFTKFFRASNVTQQDVTGTGLGLYLTKIIVENLDGEVWFTSEEGKGSTFYFSLPLHGSSPKAGKFRLETS